VSHPIASLLPVFAAALLLAACWADVATRRIPDSLPAALVLLGLGQAVLAGGFLAASIAGLGSLLAGWVLWKRGLLGGGDVKLLAGAATIAGPAGLPALAFGTAVLGGVLALPFLLARRPGLVLAPAGRAAGPLRRGLRAERRRLRRGGPLPYAVAIAGGTAVALSLGN